MALAVFRAKKPSPNPVITAPVPYTPPAYPIPSFADQRTRYYRDEQSGFEAMPFDLRKARLNVFALAKSCGFVPLAVVTPKRVSGAGPLEKDDCGVIMWNLKTLDHRHEWHPLKVTWATGGYSMMDLEEVELVPIENLPGR